MPEIASRTRTREPTKKLKQARSGKLDDRKAREAALKYEIAERERERVRQKEEAVVAKEQARRQNAIDKAEAALRKAQQEHEARLAVLDDERSAIDRRVQAEDDRWQSSREKLQAALKKAAK